MDNKMIGKTFKSMALIMSALQKLSKINRMEGLFRSSVIIIKGKKRKLLAKEEIEVIIKKSKVDPSGSFHVAARINEKAVSDDILIPILIDYLARVGMLDQKLRLKIDMLMKS